jgi:hypothetical protein
MIDSALAKEFIAYFKKLTDFYKKFFSLESEKYNDVKSGNFKALDGYIKKEQAYILKAKGFEAERKRLMGRTEKPAATFKEILPLFEGGERESAQALYGELSGVLRKFKQLNAECNRLTESKLRRASFVISKLKNNPELKKTYDEHLKSAGPAETKFLSEKV